MKASAPDVSTTTLSWVEQVPTTPITLTDIPSHRKRRIDDLIGAILATGAAILLAIIAVYATQTVTGVTNDVQDALAKIASIVVIGPIRIIDNAVILAILASVYTALLISRRWLRTIEITLAGLFAVTATLALTSLLNLIAPAVVLAALTVTFNGFTYLGISALIATLTTIAIVTGQRSEDRFLHWVWIGIWVITILAVFQGRATLPGALISVCLGITFGNLWRFIAGVSFNTAEAASLVAAILHGGITPVNITRVDHDTDQNLVTTTYTASATPSTQQAHSLPLASTLQIQAVESTPAPTDSTNPPNSPQILSRTTNRNYRVQAADGQEYLVQVIDPDRQFFTFLRTIWSNFRLRGVRLYLPRSGKASAEKRLLHAVAASQAGLPVPPVVGSARSGDSMLLISQLVAGAQPLITKPTYEVSDQTLADLWQALRQAHRAGLAHHDLDTDAVIVDPDGKAWVIDWEHAEIAPSELAKRIDLMQLLVLTSATVGSDRALQTARDQLGDETVTTLLPLLQRVALPGKLAQIDSRDRITEKLREQIQPLLTLAPDENLPIYELRRVTWRQVITSAIGLGALAVAIAFVDLAEVKKVVLAADARWIAVAFGFSLVTYLGAAINLAALTQEKLGLWRTTLVQVAASVVTLVAPAGIGPAAINLRFLTRRKVNTAVAVATVGLVQITQFIFTVALLLVVVLTTGRSLRVNLPSDEMLFIIGVVFAAILGLFAVPHFRRFLARKLTPLLNQVWPRIVWLISNPTRLIGAGLGVIIQTAAYIAAFGASLAAFGYRLGNASLSVTFLTANTLGSVIPSPGGLGPVEAALTGGLQLAGIPLAIAVSTAILYRFLTFWARVPLGFVALKYLERKRVL